MIRVMVSLIGWTLVALMLVIYLCLAADSAPEHDLTDAQHAEHAEREVLLRAYGQ